MIRDEDLKSRGYRGIRGNTWIRRGKLFRSVSGSDGA